MKAYESLKFFKYNQTTTVRLEKPEENSFYLIMTEKSTTPPHPERNKTSPSKRINLGLLDFISLGVLTFSAAIIFTLKLSAVSLAMAIGGFFGSFISCGFVWLLLVVVTIPLKYVSLRPSKSLLFFLAAVLAFIIQVSMTYLKYGHHQETKKAITPVTLKMARSSF